MTSREDAAVSTTEGRRAVIRPERVTDAMGTGAARYTVGVYCALAGALMLVAPHRLVVAPSMLAGATMAWWGMALLLAGLAVLTSTALPTPRTICYLAHLAA